MMQMAEIEGLRHRKHRFLQGDGESPLLQVYIQGVQGPHGPEVGNSITTSAVKTQLQHARERKIAREVRTAVGRRVVPRAGAVSVSFVFCPATHWNRALDAENFLKPVIDEMTLGLFHPDLEGALAAPRTRFDEDDSVFRWVCFERHDTADPEEEGVLITVWPVDRRWTGNGGIGCLDCWQISSRLGTKSRPFNKMRGSLSIAAARSSWV